MIQNLTIDAIAKYIEENIEIKKIDIEELVSYTGYSRRHLQKICKDKLGFPIGKYIQLRRITRAAALLTLSDLPISSISARLCYDSQQTFTREFKKNTGYTPLQYRNNKVLDFPDMIGYRDTNSIFSPPKVYHVDKMVIDGFLFKYKEKIPYTGEVSELRLKEIKKWFENYIYISSKISSSNISNNEIIISGVIWTDAEKANIQLEIQSGYYACFSFTGSQEEYSRFNYHIYMNLLPFYKLSKRDDFDIEIISRENDLLFNFQYYIPVMKNENIVLSYDKSPFPLIYAD